MQFSGLAVTFLIHGVVSSKHFNQSKTLVGTNRQGDPGRDHFRAR